MTNKTLIYDLETSTFGKIDSKTNILRVFGCKSYITNKIYILTKKEDILNIINAHDVVVGFNNLFYDNAVMFYNKYPNVNKNKYNDFFLKNKINVDIRDILVKRAGAMKIEKGMLKDLLMSYSLDFITKLLGLVNDDDGKIKGFNYKLLDKKVWTPEEWQIIKKYTTKDIEITDKLFQWLLKYFESFKHFLYKNDVNNMIYLTSNISVFSYKAICKKLELEEEYDSGKPKPDFGGGYVAFPAGESFEGDIICFDFNSLYPSIYHQCNLFSPVLPGKGGWHGNGKFKVNGIYNDKVQGKTEKLVIELYEDRLEFKKIKDPREYSIKIIINTMYGLTGNPTFKHLYNEVTAADCTRLGRQWTKLARKRFRDAGFKLLYTDTDSVYVLNHLPDRELILSIKDKIVQEIKDNVPFPSKHFDMGIDDEITNMWFFKGKDVEDKESDKEMDEDDFVNKYKGFMKKNYIYRTKAGKIKVKNLGVNKKSNSALSRKIFWEYLVPKIRDERKVKFSKSYLRNLITQLIEEDIKNSFIRYKVNHVDMYNSKTSIQYQISEMYGAGIHFLIPNTKKIGAGKDKNKRFCTLEEFKQYKLRLSDISTENVWQELNYFIEEEKFVDLSNF